jgi:NAD(P)-dependent dehydrogenase (short-subunit alcohol dehydrogenase family)
VNAPVYVIVGATGGIGVALSERLAERGAGLVLAARRPGPLQALAERTGGIAHALDARESGAVDGAFELARETWGRVDGAVHLVGSILLKPAHLTSPEEWRDVLATNLDSAFHLVRSAVRALRAGGGSVVLVSTAAARVGLANHEAIAAAKAGVEGLTRSAAATYAARDIRVNCVAPGLVDTSLSERLIDTPEKRASSDEMHPLGRIGAPLDVASAIDWLLDPESAWVSGQVIGVDGGLATLRARPRERRRAATSAGRSAA